MPTTVNLPIIQDLQDLPDRATAADGAGRPAGAARAQAQPDQAGVATVPGPGGAASRITALWSGRILQLAALVTAALLLCVVALAATQGATRVRPRPAAAAEVHSAPSAAAARVPAAAPAADGAGTGTGGAPPAEDPAANAALIWWRAFDALPADDDPVWTLANAWDHPLPDPAADAFFMHYSRSTQALELLALGAAAGYCEWGQRQAVNGVGREPLHVAKLRDLLELGVLRARWYAGRNQAATIVDGLVACLRAARLADGQQPAVSEFLAFSTVESHVLRAVAGVLPELDAVQLRRLTAAVAALPASASLAASLECEERFDAALVRYWLSLPLQERHRVVPDLPPELAVHGVHDPVLPADLACDASLQAFLVEYPVEVARWLAQARLPLRERLAPLAPRYTTGALPPHPLMALLAPDLDPLARAEVSLLVQRQELRAALAFLAQGAAGLDAYPDPLSGRPFRCQTTRAGFQLAADLPRYPQLQLAVGEAAAATAASGGRSPAAPTWTAAHEPKEADF